MSPSTSDQLYRTSRENVFEPSSWPDEAAAPADVQSSVRFLMTHMALIHSEVSEASEAIRKRDFENFKEERADTVIRVASIAHGLGIDLTAEIVAKLAANKERPMFHGGKAV